VSRARRIALLLAVAIGFFYLGSLSEFQWGGFAPDWVKTLLFYSAPKSNLDLGGLEEIFNTIEQHYVKGNPGGEKLTQGAASGMVTSLGDQFSRYETFAEYQANQNYLNGQFAGIGATVQQSNNQIVVANVLDGTPAQRAGMKAGDVIVAVNGQSTKGWTADDAVNHIRGDANTQVTVTVARAGQTLALTMTREIINVPSVATHVFDNRVLYIRIFDFGSHTATEFDQALKSGLKGSVNLVLLDLRDNPGGYVDAANSVISEFVPSGVTTVLVQRGSKDQVEHVSGQGQAFSNKLVVLVNENSASASEITAGALKDHHRAALVGVKTFGKGSVQEDFKVRDGYLHLTIAAWLTPDRHSIDKVGITPDDVVALASSQAEYSVQDAPNDFANDTQLKAALALLEA
jgi:carboxyl-terminal processing protease